MNPFQCDEGGVTAPGSIILWAFPYQGQKNSAFVYEGDRFGGKIRSPEDVRPVHPHNIVASNHHKVHGFDSESEQPQLSFGRNVSFSSRWRYETGMNELKARSRQEKRLEINLTKRIDLILVKSGDELSDRILFPDETYVWPSDHAGVIALLRIPVLGN